MTTKPTIQRGVIWAGLAMVGALYFISSHYFPETVVGFAAQICLIGLLGGFFTASLAKNRKTVHSLYTGIAFVGLSCVPFFVEKSVSNALADNDASGDQNVAFHHTTFFVFFTTCLSIGILLAFLAGRYLERVLVALENSLWPRRSWNIPIRYGETTPVQDPSRQPIQTIFWWLVGWLLILSCWLPLLENNWSEHIVRPLSFLVVGYLCLAMAKQRSTISVSDVLSNHRPIGIYLRSFSDDGRKPTEGKWSDYTQGLFSNLILTMEEQFIRALRRSMGFIAIGKPGEILPSMGAARMYVSDDKWQSVICGVLSLPKAVAILQAGQSDGLRWEFARVRNDLHPEQVLLVVPFGLLSDANKRETQYDLFADWAKRAMETRFPDRLGDSCFIYFTATSALWTAHILRRGEAILADHALTEILRTLQRKSALWPQNQRRQLFLWRALLIAWLLLPFLAGFWTTIRAHPANESTTFDPKNIKLPTK